MLYSGSRCDIVLDVLVTKIMKIEDYFNDSTWNLNNNICEIAR